MASQTGIDGVNRGEEVTPLDLLFDPVFAIAVSQLS
jgi:hypothetical protein